MSDNTPQVSVVLPQVESSPGSQPESREPENESGGLRLWPALVIVVLFWVVSKFAAWAAPATLMHFYAMFMGPMIATGAVVLWWLFASRLPWRDRGLGLVVFGAAAATSLFFAHPTLRGMPMIVFALPVAITTWAAWLMLTPFLGWPVRRIGLFVVFALTWGYFALLRLDGINGSMVAEVPFRWAVTPEQKFLAQVGSTTREADKAAPAETVEPSQLASGDWPGFRGPGRDGRLPGVRIATDWQGHPPREVWRHRVGPGWSSFAVVGNRLYTQEQYGEEEVVICYDAATGADLWIHRDHDRFNEAMAGPGPRATPTFVDGKIYALGAKGLLNCLDAATGAALWSHDIKPDAGLVEPPTWGFASSPLVVSGIVTVFAGGADGKSVLGYDASSGKLAWTAGDGQFSYSSTQFSRLAGVEQLVIATSQGLTALEPSGGAVLWTFPWPLEGQMSRCIQPAIVGDSDVLIGTGFGIGTKRVHVARIEDAWTADDVWPEPTRAIRPYYNDLVVHHEHLYGFDGAFFTCVSLSDGKAIWKTRGYGNGQVLLLPDQDLLVILSETGEVALVAAKPDRHSELARLKAIEGKTWNHPVIAHSRLFVRNGEEAACFELTEEIETEVSRRE